MHSGDNSNYLSTYWVMFVSVLGCRLVFEPAPGINEILDFLSFGKSYANSHFILKICDP